MLNKTHRQHFYWLMCFSFPCVTLNKVLLGIGVPTLLFLIIWPASSRMRSVCIVCVSNPYVVSMMEVIATWSSICA